MAFIGGGERSSNRVLVGKPEERSCLENLGRDGSATLKGGVKKIRRWGGMEWVDLAQDGYRWQALVKKAIALNAFHFLTV